MPSFLCGECGATFARKRDRDRHSFLVHQNVEIVHQCVYCAAIFNSVAKLKEHRRNHRPRTGFQIHKSAHDGKCVIWRKIFETEIKTVEEAFENVREEMFKLISYELVQRKSIKASICYNTEFEKTEGERELRYPICLRSPSKLLVGDSDIKDLIYSSKKIVDQRVDDLIHHGTG